MTARDGVPALRLRTQKVNDMVLVDIAFDLRQIRKLAAGYAAHGSGDARRRMIGAAATTR